VDTRDRWNEWSELFDLFMSYARKDNETGMVSALVEAIQADFARFSPSLPLKVFFDKQSILDMQYWQDRLKKGLRQSKVMLAVLSEAYFNSAWCRNEWDEYLRVEQARTYPDEALNQSERLIGQTVLWLVSSLQDLGRLQSGLDMARLANRVLQQVAEADPTPPRNNATWAYSHIRLFEVKNKLGNRAAVRAELAAFVAVWEKLEAEGRLPAPSDGAALKRRWQQLDEWAD
jgi:hypothetical protein